MKVQVLLDKLCGVVSCGEGYKALCPCHDDVGQSLRILVQNNKVLLKCFAGCSTEEILKHLGLSFRDLFNVEGSAVDNKPIPSGGDAIFLGEVYRIFLDNLSLSKEHQRKLLERGLTQENVTTNMYRSLTPLTAARAAKVLREIYGEALLGVPGFTAKGTSHSTGLLIPVRNPFGYIQGFQIRRDSGEPKYVWFSGGTEGLSSLVHAVGDIGGKEVVHITEGPLKADVVGALDPTTLPILGVCGVGSWKAVLPVLSLIRPKTVRVAFDADWQQKLPVFEHLCKCVRSLVDAGYLVRVESWPLEAAKGLDDLLIAGKGHLRERWEVAKPSQWIQEVKRRHLSIGGDVTSVVVAASAIKQRKLEWIWPKWIPRGCLTILEGDPDQGKSTLVCDLVARVVTGDVMPSGPTGMQDTTSVLLLTAEDDSAVTVVPRLRAAGVTGKYLDKVYFWKGVTSKGNKRLPEFPKDLEALREIVGELNPGMVVVDPIAAFLGPTVSMYKDQDMRQQVLAPLAQISEELGVTFLVIRHLTKMSGMSPLYRGGGSVSLVAAARSCLLVYADPAGEEDSHILVSVKGNLGIKPKGLRYRLVPWGDDPGIGKVEWCGEVEYTAKDCGKQQRGSDKGERIMAWLDVLLADYGDAGVPTLVLQRMAEQAGFRWKAVVGVLGSNLRYTKEEREGDNGQRFSIYRIASPPTS